MLSFLQIKFKQKSVWECGKIMSVRWAHGAQRNEAKKKEAYMKNEMFRLDTHSTCTHNHRLNPLKFP